MASTTTYAPTSEQEAALALFETGASFAIEAGAGTGKTSTLRLLAESTSRHGQYVAFNKAIVEEAKLKMPGSCAASTAHSLAMRSFGFRYRHRLDRSARMRSSDIALRLGIERIALTTQDGERKLLTPSFLAGLATRAAVRFCQSADLEPGEQHIPYVQGIDVPPGEMSNNWLVRHYLVDSVRAIWRDALDVDGNLPYRHDYYLKGWQLDDPRISASYILFDEAQDANPVMVAIVAAQEHAQLVWVGDSQQQIYSFTGAVNALANVPADHRTFLTRSFRFGPAIADVANHCLSGLDADLRIEGAGNPDSRVGGLPEPDAVLTRTNAAAVRAVLQAQAEGTTVHLVGGGIDVVKFAKAAQLLMDGRRPEHPDLACFDTWGEVVEYVAQDEQGGDLRLMVALVNEFTVPVILAALDNMIAEARADLIVSTAHKAKGREWSTVKLGDDFPAIPSGEELRLLYVAATRARDVLDVTAIEYLSAAAIATARNIEAVTALTDLDHDAVDHDHAACVECNEQSRQADVDSETADDEFLVTADGVSMGEYIDVDEAKSVAWALYRGGVFMQVSVYDGADLVVAYER